MDKNSDITHRRVLKIAVPIVISNATVPILGAVDTGVVGQLGLAAPIGAVGIGAIIISSIYWIFGFLRMGTTGLTAQAIGASNHDETSALLTRSLMIGVAGGIVIILLQMPLFWMAFKLSPASEHVETLATDYMRIRIYSAPAAIAIYGLTGWLIAHEKTGSVLIIQLWMNGLNILLDIWFVLGLGWGVSGVAVATFIAEWSGFALALWSARFGFQNGLWNKWRSVFNREKLINMMAVNSDILIRSVLLMLGFNSFLFLAADFGDVTLAANQVLLQFLYIIAYALDGFAFAVEPLVGQALGTKDRKAFRSSVMLTSFWGVLIVLIGTILIWLGGPYLIDLITTAPDVRTEARHYLFWMILAPITGVACWMLDGVFIGATRTKDMRNMMLLSVVGYGISLWVLLPVFGNHGLWASFNIFFILRGVTLGWKYPALEASVEAAK